jgi:hypothetical protein
MSARLLATLVWVMSVAPCFGSPEPVGPAMREVVVYLKSAEAQPTRALEAMKREASGLMEPGGYRVTWRDLPESAADAVEAAVVIVELRGACQAPKHAEALPPLIAPASLASTAVANGEVLPFSWLECGTLSRMLAPEIAKHDSGQDSRFGRAMGRLLAHELFHVLTNTTHHANEGVGKPYFSAKDVLAERFEFETETLVQLRAPAPSDDTGDDPEQAGP